MDQTTCEKLLNLSFEIEGLVMLLRERADCTPDEVMPLLRDKVSALNALIGNESADKSVAAESVVAEPMPQESPAEPTPESTPETTPQPEVSPRDADAEAEVEESESEAIADVSLQPSLFDADPEPVERIDARFARESARDIHRAFTINDRFRFKRELFGNSNTQLNDALDVIAAMNSYEEAEDYFYNDLVWDKESDDVKDFMSVVAHHFENVR